MIHTWATDTDDPTEQPRWGRVGKQKIVDEGPLAPYADMSNVPNMHDISPKAKYDMGTFYEVLLDTAPWDLGPMARDVKRHYDAAMEPPLPTPETYGVSLLGNRVGPYIRGLTGKLIFSPT